jgi:hypothetical protein
MIIYTKWITLKNGVRIYAHQYGLEAFRFEVSEEEHRAYLKKREKKKKES